MDPSPTAEATRFTLSERISPTANTPGRLVSSRNGGRRKGHSAPRSGPVLMNCLLSSATQFSSHAVLGLAPVNTNMCRTSQTFAVPLFLSRHPTRSRCPLPSSVSTSVKGLKLICSQASIREIKYRDMLSARPGPRTSKWTCLATPDRNMAAWPAEFPPPTTATSSPLHSWASTAVAP